MILVSTVSSAWGNSKIRFAFIDISRVCSTMTSTESSDVIAKRASVAVDEEKVESLLMKKRKAEDSGSEWESESESEDEGEKEVYKVGEEKLPDGSVRVFNGCFFFTYVPEPEPMWDVDSFDELGYESDPKVRDLYSDEDEYAEYRNERIQALESKGFLPDPYRHIRAIKDLERSAGDNMTNREYLAKLAKVCVVKLNKEKGTTVEFVRVERANVSGGGRWKFYITFKAKEYPNGREVDYQAKVMDFAGESQAPFPILCRPAPKPLSKPPS